MECFLYEDSIQCDLHPSAIIEKRVGNRFFRWQPCAHCDGTGKIHPGSRYERVCGDCKSRGGDWQPPNQRAAPEGRSQEAGLASA